MDDVKCITAVEFSELLGVSKCTAYHIIRSADFYPAFRIGRKWFVNLEELKHWMAEQSAKTE